MILSLQERGSFYSQFNTLAVHYVSFKAQHCKHHQGRQDGGEEVDKGNQDGIELAVVVPFVVAGESDDTPKAETKGVKDLRGCLTPNLGVQHDLQLKAKHEQIWQNSAGQSTCMIIPER